MAGYLDQYGAGEERRIKIIKTVVISILVLLVAGAVLLFFFHNYRQEHQVKQFFEALQRHDYQAAYNMWAPNESDRKGYPFEEFMKDWGPEGSHRDVASFKITKSRSCGSGVILTVNFNTSPEERLWVERDALTIGYSPTAGSACPAVSR